MHGMNMFKLAVQALYMSPPHGCRRRRVGALEEMLKRRQMERLPVLHLAVVSLLGFCCLIHASRAAISFSAAAPREQLQKTDAIPASSGADGQAVVAGEVDRGAVSRRMEMEMQLEDYPGSGPNDHHSPWWRQERRN
ncbi:uncharacterized protein LOC119302287 [Triticum dicoccoides]|uniref:uncharacterized protein LOC119302287 n=1 Tax=Triticum dicoccoides TaxID=85692 RepID=UPI00188E7ABF|nr:uncharacterized protein LOC119302287 [Triticum dicoccoides]